MTLSLFLVRGHDIEGENQDAFVVASDVETSVRLWNDWCRHNGMARDWDTDEDDDTIVQPQGSRMILADVTGTAFDGEERFVEWDEVPEMLNDD